MSKIYCSSYGISGDDNTPAFKAAVAKAKEGDSVIFPSGKFNITDTILIKNKGIKLIGDNTWLYQYLDKPVFVFDRDQPTLRAFMSDIHLNYSYGQGEVNGIEIAVPITMENCTVNNFTGNGIVVSADVHSRPGTDCSWNTFWEIYIGGCKKNGMLFQGGDANNCYVHVDVRDCGECGVKDSSMLGNRFDDCQAHNNKRNYMADNLNSRARFIGCYSEMGSLPEYLAGTATWRDGYPANGIELHNNASFAYGNQLLYNKDGQTMSLVKDIFNIYPSI